MIAPPKHVIYRIDKFTTKPTWFQSPCVTIRFGVWCVHGWSMLGINMMSKMNASAAISNRIIFIVTYLSVMDA